MFAAISHMDEICIDIFRFLSFHELSNSIYFVSRHFYELANASNILFANLCEGEMNFKGIVAELNPYRSEIDKLLWPECMQHFCTWKKIFILLNSKSDIDVYMSDVILMNKFTDYLFKIYTLYFNEECMKLLQQNKGIFIRAILDFRLTGKIRLFQTELFQPIDAKLIQFISNHKTTLRMNLYWSTLLPTNTIHSKLLDQIISSEEKSATSQVFKSISELQEFKTSWDKEKIAIEEDAQRRSRYQIVTLPMFRVWLYNDESHSFDQVVNTLRNATRKTYEECDSITWMAHSDQKSICYESEDFDKAMTVAVELDKVKLGYHVEKITKKYHFAANILSLLETCYKKSQITEKTIDKNEAEEEKLYRLLLHYTRGKSVNDFETDFEKIPELRDVNMRFAYFMFQLHKDIVLYQSSNKSRVEQLFQLLDSKLYNVSISIVEEVQVQEEEEEEEEAEEEEEGEEDAAAQEEFLRLLESIQREEAEEYE